MNNSPYDTPTSAFIDILMTLMDRGKVQTVRGMKTKELLSQTFTILEPEKRCILVPGRNDNIFAKVAETLWMLSGRNDIGWLSYYLPRAADFSDDGKTWRGGYGPRLRKWGDQWNDDVDQLQYVVDLLNRDPQTRQAVISIWDPIIDTQPGKDIPCNNWIQFLIRDGDPNTAHSSKRFLHMNVTQRSSDWMWGFSGIDLFSWSVLQQMVAYWTNCWVGNLTWFVGSLHVYEKHWDRAEKMIKQYTGGSIYDRGIHPVEFSTGFSLFDDMNKIVTEDSVGYPVNHMFGDRASTMQLYTIFSQMLWLYEYYKDIASQLPGKTVAGLAGAVEQMATCDMKMAAIEYFSRVYGNDFLQNVMMSVQEMAAFKACEPR